MLFLSFKFHKTWMTLQNFMTNEEENMPLTGYPKQEAAD